MGPSLLVCQLLSKIKLDFDDIFGRVGVAQRTSDWFGSADSATDWPTQHQLYWDRFIRHMAKLFYGGVFISNYATRRRCFTS